MLEGLRGLRKIVLKLEIQVQNKIPKKNIQLKQKTFKCKS
jgi:hypothetical protein